MQNCKQSRAKFSVSIPNPGKLVAALRLLYLIRVDLKGI